MDSQLQQTIDYIREQISIQPRIAIILGSGLGSFANLLENKKKLSADSIPHYPKTHFPIIPSFQHSNWGEAPMF